MSDDYTYGFQVTDEEGQLVSVNLKDVATATYPDDQVLVDEHQKEIDDLFD